MNAETSPDTSVHLTSTHVICTQTKSQPKSDCQITAELSKFWQLENSGVESENGLVHDRFEETVVFYGTRYQVSLLFKERHALLSDNSTLSKQM